MSEFGHGAAALGLCLALSAGSAMAGPTLNFYGAPGGIDMPSGEAAPDGTLSGTVSYFGGTARGTLSFQFAPWIGASIRYSDLQDLNLGRYRNYQDRSFDLRFRLFGEGAWMPSVTLGLQDFVGTGIYSAEYVAATKNFGRLKVTAGLGWGRLGSYNDIGSPFGARPDAFSPQGGQANARNWFRGPVAPFGGLEYVATDRLRLKLEYSSDAYDLETGTGMIDRKSPVNLGIEYHEPRIGSIGLYYLYGSMVGVSANFALHPKQPLIAYAGPAAPAFVPRAGTAKSWDGAWSADPGASAALRQRLAQALAGQDLVLEGLRLTSGEAVLYLRNWHYDAEPQAVGRALRVMSAVLPPSVETLTVVPVVSGMEASSLTFRRSDLERLDAAEAPVAGLYDRAQVGAPLSLAPADRVRGVYPRFSWAIRPEVLYTWFNPEQPTIWDIVKLQGDYEVAPGAILRGSVSQKVFSRGHDKTPAPPGALPHVRTDSPVYAAEGDTVLETLTANYYFRAGPSVYGRLTAGYLERMFGGVSAELLWSPADSPLALGLEADYVGQRAYDGGFGFRDYRVGTGHVSAYYQFGHGYEGAIHAGRYLAGDWGATLELGRRFDTGVEISAFATRTNVSASDFGEGSFDKGIRIEIPLSYLTGRPSRITGATTIRSIQRDGGQMLNVDGRLYDEVRDYHQKNMAIEWGSLWR